MKKIIGFLIIVLISWFGSKFYYSKNNDELKIQNQNAFKIDSLIQEINRINAENKLPEVDSVNYIPKFTKEKGTLKADELVFLKETKKHYPEIEIPENVIRNYKFSETEGRDILMSTEFSYVRDEETGLYFDGYVYYDISLKQDKTNSFEYVLEYKNSMGKASVSSGFIVKNVMNDEMIKIDYTFGTGAGSTEIHVNGKKEYENFTNFED